MSSRLALKPGRYGPYKKAHAADVGMEFVNIPERYDRSTTRESSKFSKELPDSCQAIATIILSMKRISELLA